MYNLKVKGNVLKAVDIDGRLFDMRTDGLWNTKLSMGGVCFYFVNQESLQAMISLASECGLVCEKGSFTEEDVKREREVRGREGGMY